MEYTVGMINRIKRIDGQLHGISSLMEEGRDCREVVLQMAAARNALDKTIGLVVRAHLEHCVRQHVERGEGSEETIKEAINMFVKSR